MIWNQQYETMPRDELRKLQLLRLKQLVENVYHRVPFYRDAFDKAGVKPEDIKSLDDLKRLPFTYKQDMRDNYPFGMFAVPQEQVVRIHASSGTTGKPTVVGYTARDIDTWAELMARTVSAAGVGRGDILQNAYGYGLFTGGLGAHYGAEKVGASVIPISGGNSKKQLMLLKDFGSTAISCTPSYALSLYETAVEEGVKREDLKLKVGIFGAEPWTEAMRQEIEAKWQIDAVDIYGLSEIIGPGVGYECIEEKRGMHISEDHFIVETINPDTGEVLPAGEEGELVFTTITKEAIPLIRYRTRDITRLITDPCRCGRSFVRMNKVTGRSDDMLIIRGVNVFPSQVEAIIVTKAELSPHYLLIIDRVDNLDTLEIQIELAEGIFMDRISRLQELSRSVEKEIKDMIGVTCKVRIVEHKTIARSEGKAQRVLDRRKL
ncbi:phenylacetate--CoA ligase family protein [Seleniivibrio woodruffii]|uniref:Phenylacetate-coenzyme A ligase n=1 Tax=Seleniivibrio woodruffii TaxID=1078050 RepID=A0A4R1KB55_9BACT|nr:phenylacetate--CoA ligase [Seleniivibrio woodruffii]TCK60369.1 phenylacetate-CoA ligase [Seleniivibrio woodruffii]TVZ35996.1 phenylacetate-CoA ligase [Seleniivibrio woodruffii]